MSGLVQTLFGGSTTNQQSTSTPQNFTNPSLSGLAPGLGNSLTSLVNSLTGSTNNANPNGGVTPTTQAPVTGQEQSLLNQIPGQTGPGTASAQYLKQVLGGSYLPGGPNANPALAATITAAQRPTLDNLTNTLTKPFRVALQPQDNLYSPIRRGLQVVEVPHLTMQRL